MAYTIILIFIIIYIYLIQDRINNKKDYVLLLMPVWLLLIVVLGTQYNVGTDYNSYLQIADGTKNIKWIEGRSEILFILLVSFVKWIGYPQLIFVFSAVIQISFLSLIVYEIKKMDFKLSKFFFLYFTLLLIFFNQFNGIRQYIAVYMIIYAILQLKNEKKLLFILLVILARFFHYSAIFSLIFLLVDNILRKKIRYSYILVISIILTFMSFFDLTIIYEFILSFTKYKSYINHSYFQRTPIQGIITKIPKLIIVLYSSYLIQNRKSFYKFKYLINMSYISCFTLILTFSSSLLWRFYQYLDFFLIFPVLIVMNENPKRNISILFALILFGMFFVKVAIIPRGEYLYDSILLSIIN